MLASLIPILVALLLGAMAPGPSFVLVTRTAVTQSRRNGLAAAVGMGVGGTFFGTLALLGLTALLTQVAWLNMALRLAGGLYLLYLALRMWRGAGTPLAMSADTPAQGRAPSLGRAFVVALATQLSNPKTAIAYASIFAALLPAQSELGGPPSHLLLVLPPVIFLIEAGWYGVVAAAFSAAAPRRAYLKAKGGIDRVTGTVMGALGLRLVADAVRDAALAR
ncbi:LysE family translocator [Nitrospirillum amazonense]|uniref:Threonine/homoserine/homoserine lactone efflux protein n=1 Tax=Nitrospirillum amazonense TaxID=28077 RepID=A0A560KHR9_9PROT|nr:LysE family transporter [Nitrospirillum amazonense]MDG3443073.1 LysE family transporter [Nitrospirillum amazonense]TWB82787.1 threonine/homoserine/homoserine lactone efflux protein [Nitrospirillum amazonense]